MSETAQFSQSLQNCKSKFDIAMECFGNLVKYAVHEDEDEKKMELLGLIHNSTKALEKFTDTLFEEPKTKRLKSRSFEISHEVPDKKLKLSPSPLMDLPSEIWMKILGFLPAQDILQNFNLTCKYFHSLAINPGAIKSLQLKLENIKDSTQYHEIVKVLKRSKTLNKLVIDGCGRMNNILAHALKSNHLKTLEVSSSEATLSKKNLEYMKNSNIEHLKLDKVTLNDEAMQLIGSLKTLKSVRISLNGRPMNISEMVKNFTDAKIGLEDFAIETLHHNAHHSGEIKASTLYTFLKERRETLKKLKICCIVGDDGKFDMKWNVPSNLEELYYCDLARRTGRHPIKIEFGENMSKLTKLSLRNINMDMLSMFETRNFPLLERLYLEKGFSHENVPQANLQTIFNIVRNCPNLKSVKLSGFDVNEFQNVVIVSGPLPKDWVARFAFLCYMYKKFNAYIDILGSHYTSSFSKSPLEAFEKYLKKTDLATFYKYTKMKANYLDWKGEQRK